MKPPVVRCLVALALYLSLPAQDPPKVLSLDPADGVCVVDAAKTKTLTVVFDRPMGKGRSVVGGGPNFPEVQGVDWKDDRTLVIRVKLLADHDYRMGLNGGRFTNFRSKEGVALVPRAWTFTTLPTQLRDPKVQSKRNREAFAALQELLPASYSYYDLRVKDWTKAFGGAEARMLAAPTDVAWASAVARMLEPTEDIHMYLRFGQRTFPVGRRAVDPLYRARRLSKYLGVRQVGGQALLGRTKDDIGYLMIGSWTDKVDLDAIEKELAGRLGCKAFVIDARPNSGGSETLARRIAAWFVDGTKVYAKNRYRTGKGTDGFGDVLDRAITGNGADRRFAGPIAVLTSRYVMSSNEAFVLMLRQADDCLQVGQPTYGSSGNPKPHELPNGVTLVMPSWQALRPDGTCFEGEGIAPEVVVPVKAKELQTRDPILERALELLRDKVKK